MPATQQTTSDPEEAWLQLAEQLGTNRQLAYRAFADLAQRYAEGHRVYHTLDHAWHVVQQAIALSSNPAIPTQIAAWLHDAIYDPRAADNEERSAAYAVRFLQTLQQPQTLIVEVQRLILLTRRHAPARDDDAGCVLVDADLAILGAPAQEYARYAAAIRREYGWLPDDAYRRGRLAVLQQFLQRPFIYHTDHMRRQREQAARGNIRAEIERLS